METGFSNGRQVSKTDYIVQNPVQKKLIKTTNMY